MCQPINRMVPESEVQAAHSLGPPPVTSPVSVSGDRKGPVVSSAFQED